MHESLEELGRLADTAGLEVVGQTYQMLDEVGGEGRAAVGSGGGAVVRWLRQPGVRTQPHCSPPPALKRPQTGPSPELLPPVSPSTQVNPRTYIGSGKVREIMAAVENTGATTVIFDDELSPGACWLARAAGRARCPPSPPTLSQVRAPSPL